MEVANLVTGLRQGRPAAVARAISVVENERPGFEQLLAAVHPDIGRARRIGLTGPPGAGKSTVTERLTAAYRARGLTVAIVAVDPTSPFTGGALLGDRIRMESVALDPGVFIRSMASRGSLGGLAMATREVCDLLDAAGFDRILIETVGVGQSELDVARMADSTVLVLVPESGDGIQTLKSGIMEAADLFVVNKADRPGAEKLRREVEIALELRRGRAGKHVAAHHGIRAGRVEAEPADDGTWTPPVLLASAAKNEGIDALVDALDRHHAWLTESGTMAERRRRRLGERARDALERNVRHWLWRESGVNETIESRLDALAAGETTPYALAAELMDLVRQGERV